MPVLQRRTTLPVTVDVALSVSLDLDVELAVGAGWRLRALADGYGFRTAGQIGRGEMVRWAARLWGVVPIRHTSKIVTLVEDDGRGGALFVDQMTTGVFAAYRHEHVFRPVVEGTRVETEMVDEVTWTSPLGPLGALADRVFVRRTLDRLLTERNAEIRRRVTPV